MIRSAFSALANSSMPPKSCSPGLFRSLLLAILALPVIRASPVNVLKRSGPFSDEIKPLTLPNLSTNISASSLSAGNFTTTSSGIPACWPAGLGPDPAPIPILHPSDCGKAIGAMLSEGHVDEKTAWFSEQAWIHKSCGIYLLPKPEFPYPIDHFSRLEIARELANVQTACVNMAHDWRGGNIAIGMGVFEVGLLGLPPNGDWDAKLVNTTDLMQEFLALQPKPQVWNTSSFLEVTNASNSALINGSTGLEYPPDCWPFYSPPGAHNPIANPEDCGDAVAELLRGHSMTKPILWTTSMRWTSGSCSIALTPDRPSSRDTFSRLDITRAAAHVRVSCVNEAHNFRGGAIDVGPLQIFDVSVEAPEPEDPPTLEQRATPPQPKPIDLLLPLTPNGPTTTTIRSNKTTTPNLSSGEKVPYCYPSAHPSPHHPTSIHPISNPVDCTRAIAKVTIGAPAYPETWDEHEAWFDGSCAVWLMPNQPSEAEPRDTFSRWTIESVAVVVMEACVTGGNGYRGGEAEVGGRGFSMSWLRVVR